jgi:hypothetical protein
LLELGGYLTHESLEGELADEQIGLNKKGRGKRSPTLGVGGIMTSYALLEFSDLSQGDRSWLESVGFLDSGDDGGGLAGYFLGRQLFAGHLLRCGLARGLFGSCHFQ